VRSALFGMYLSSSPSAVVSKALECQLRRY
jgi:hypothetical protein